MTIEGVQRIRCDHCGWTTTFSGTMLTREWVERSLRRDWIVIDTPQGRYTYEQEHCARAEHPDAEIDVTNLEERAEEWVAHMTTTDYPNLIGTHEQVERVLRHLEHFNERAPYLVISAITPWPGENYWGPKHGEIVQVDVRRMAR